MKGSEDRAARPRGVQGLGRVFTRRHGPAPKPDETDTRPVHWWVAFYHGGHEVREPARPNTRKAAADLLRKRLGETSTGSYAGPGAERVMFEDLVALLVDDYTVQGRVSLDTAKRSIAHLRETFGSHRALAITGARIESYKAARLAGGAKPATVQKELAALGRMFTLALKRGLLTVRPHFDRLKVENTRTVSFTDAELAALLDVLEHGRPATVKDPAVKAQPQLGAPVVFAALTCWRIRSDVFTLQWRQVDFDAGTVTRWSRGTTKAHEHTVFPFAAMPDLAALLQRQREVTDAVQREQGRIVPHVFHRNGKAIKSADAGWRAACKAAGLAGRKFHDLRRTGARSLRTLGMPDRDTMEMGGWSTPAMLTRYLGRDPAGCAERLRGKLAEAEVRTKYGRFQSEAATGEK